MKPCCRCGSIQNVMVKGKGYCRPCNNKYGRKFYAENREKRLKAIAVNVKTHKLKRKAMVDEIKSRPCMDCGGSFPPICMDFDHRPGEIKWETVAVIVGTRGNSLKRLLDEIKKCDVVCANCHRIRTHLRGYAGIAQVAEHTIDNREVEASTASPGTI